MRAKNIELIMNNFIYYTQNRNKIMSQSVINPARQNCQNPQDNSTKAKSVVQLDEYELHQSFFTKQQLLTQQQFKVIRFEQNYDSVQPVLHGGFGSDIIYMGGLHMGLYHGWGILVSKTTTYEGRFSLGHKMGKGYMKFANHSVYVGDFTNDRPHGQGMMQRENQYYIGDFQNGAMQGDGLWRNEKHQKYVGSWKNNKAHGYGIYQTQKSHYQGQFANFIKHGYGMQNFPNGDFYKGYYVQGKPQGKGQYHWANGATYVGEFVNGLRQGEGVWTGENGDKYIGIFSNDRKNGPGQYYWENGNIYKGNFSQDMRQGQGQMAWVDGSTYSGQWQRGLPHGKGVFKIKGEKPRAGFFEDNVLVKQSKHKESRSSQKLNSKNYKDSLILSMIPQMGAKSKKRKLMRSQKKQHHSHSRNPFSSKQALSFMNTTTKVRSWRSRNQKR